MLTKIYLSDWFYNAGIIGFLKILENSNDNFAQIKSNYIEFDIEKLKEFNKYYFKYFIDKYNIAKKLEGQICRPIERIQARLEQKSLDKKFQKESQEKVKNDIQYIKEKIKIQMEKIKKFDSVTYQQMLNKYNQIDGINGNIDKLKIIKKEILEILSRSEINNKITMNLFKNILSRNYFGQPSFLNVSCSDKTFEVQQLIMYKDYISNIIETDFLAKVLNNKYKIQEIKKHIEKTRQEKNTTQQIAKVYDNIKKLIENGKDVEEVKRYIQEKIFSNCYMCENSNCITEEYSEKHFAPLAISSKKMSNFFWNQNVDFPICDICKLILFCIPAGITSINKTVKEYDKGKNVYKEKEILSFVNYDTSVKQLLKVNRNFANNLKTNPEVENPYVSLILDIVEQDEKISYWQLENIFVVEFEAEYKAFSRINYFNIRRYVARFFKKYSRNTLKRIDDYKFKLQIVDYMLKNKDIDYVINDRLREKIKGENKCGYNILLATKVRRILNLLRKEGEDVEKNIKKEDRKINVLYNLGIQIHDELKKKGEENKLTGYEYKMLNSIKAGNKQEFIDVVIRLHMLMRKDVSPIFLEVMQQGNLDLSSIGYSFIAGLISNKYERKVED